MKIDFRESDCRYFLGFSLLFPLINYARLLKLARLYNFNLKEAWDGRFNWPIDSLGFRKKEDKSAFKSKLESIDISLYLEEIEALGISWFCLAHSHYPSKLRCLKNPPLVVYYKGNKDLLIMKSIAMVGSRLMTSYGVRVVKEMVPDFTRAGFCIVSGLALGADALSHKVALESGGSTIAVMPCGLDMVVPRTNVSLFNRIYSSSKGLVISEFPLKVRPRRYFFPLRSRVVAALCEAVVVVEAGKKSGTQYTAKEGLKQKKAVFAVPGSINSPLSHGPNSLIAQTIARPALSAASVLMKLGSSQKLLSNHTRSLIDKLSLHEKEVYGIVSLSSLEFDDLLQEVSFGATVLNKVLTSLEIKGMVSSSDGRYTAV